MKKRATFFLLNFLLLSAFAQQLPSYTQYTLNRFALNPAVAGIKSCADTKFGSRRQWVGFEGAPTTYFATFNTRLNKDDKYPDEIHAIGFHILQDRNGFNNQSYVKAAYAFHLKLWTNYRLSFGVYVGIQRFSQSFNSIRIPNKGFDPAINSEAETVTVFPEISPGGFLYNKNLYFGLSMLQAYPTQIKDLGTKDHHLTAHYFLTSGYRIRGFNLHYIPSILINFSPFISPTVDMTLTFDYQRKISLGLGSKYLNSGYMILSINILKTVTLGYSYEYAFNEISRTSPTTHEIIIGISTCAQENEKSKFFCPAYQ